MWKNKFCLILLSCLFGTLSYSNTKKNTLMLPEDLKPTPPIEIPLIPLVPALPNAVENIDEEGNIRHLEKNYTIMVEAKVNIFVPLEIVSDINVNADVFGDQVVNIPFMVELNRAPEKLNYYKLKYSETELDIDNDGRNDVFIYSPEYINTRYVTDNYVQVHGDKISKEGSYKKSVYVTVEAGI
ncbi:hypothetical protein [Cetobacterium sp.]|uniref:hypothetical protein n=1 Tax=Cetobacterium sp. TaxID=2071632 RepID=UPI003F2E7694